LSQRVCDELAATNAQAALQADVILERCTRKKLEGEKSSESNADLQDSDKTYQ
jgi:hypothetical protein